MRRIRLSAARGSGRERALLRCGGYYDEWTAGCSGFTCRTRVSPLSLERVSTSTARMRYSENHSTAGAYAGGRITHGTGRCSPSVHSSQHSPHRLQTIYTHMAPSALSTVSPLTCRAELECGHQRWQHAVEGHRRGDARQERWERLEEARLLLRRGGYITQAGVVAARVGAFPTHVTQR